MKPFFHERIQQKYDNLTRSQVALSKYVTEKSDEAAFLSSSVLARKCQVSNATVTRFCLTLGYSGYVDFQKDVQRWIQMKLTPFERFQKASQKKNRNLYGEIINQESQNLKKMLDAHLFSQIENAANSLNRARRIFIIGLRLSFPLAWLTYYQLSRILRNVYILNLTGGLLHDSIIDIGPADGLIAISFSRYAKETTKMAQYAKSQGCRIVAITDSLLSPIAQASDIVIEVKINSPSFIGSCTGAVCAINCLCAGVSLLNSKRSMTTLKEMEGKLVPLGTWIV